MIKDEESTRRLELLGKKQKKVRKVGKNKDGVRRDEGTNQIGKEIVEIQKNLESYQKEGKRTKLSSAPKGWKSEKDESQHAQLH